MIHAVMKIASMLEKKPLRTLAFRKELTVIYTCFTQTSPSDIKKNLLLAPAINMSIMYRTRYTLSYYYLYEHIMLFSHLSSNTFSNSCIAF